ncbi:hypothetical protein EJ110_NYTH49647 [Nymphaea thermarum]|nr:hypothetical protein EJ110_NYTH49647 [Nymphaea thermarum]
MDSSLQLAGFGLSPSMFPDWGHDLMGGSQIKTRLRVTSLLLSSRVNIRNAGNALGKLPDGKDFRVV